MSQIEPVSPALIDANPAVHLSFQADEDFTKIHTSSSKADRLHGIAPDCVFLGSKIGRVAGLPPLERIVASSSESRLMIFSLEAEKASPPGPRVFGLMTDSTVTVDEAARFIKPLL